MSRRRPGSRKFARLRDIRGVTLTELVVVIAFLAAVGVPLGVFLSNTIKGVTRTNLSLQSQDDLRGAMSRMERDFSKIVHIETANSSPPEFKFRLDSSQRPSYAPKSLAMVNTTCNKGGISLDKDHCPDDDGDAPQRLSAIGADQLKYGYDVEDDDDDNDANVDYACRYRLSTAKSLTRQCWENGTPGPEAVLAKNILQLQFTYFGSADEDNGRFIDLGNDGAFSTPPDADGSQGDGIITAAEIDGVGPNDTSPEGQGVGNESGGANPLDTDEERDFIFSIRVEIKQDKNNDGKADFSLETQIAPPLLQVRRRR